MIKIYQLRRKKNRSWNKSLLRNIIYMCNLIRFFSCFWIQNVVYLYYYGFTSSNVQSIGENIYMYIQKYVLVKALIDIKSNYTMLCFWLKRIFIAIKWPCTTTSPYGFMWFNSILSIWTKCVLLLESGYRKCYSRHLICLQHAMIKITSFRVFTYSKSIDIETYRALEKHFLNLFLCSFSIVPILSSYVTHLFLK